MINVPAVEGETRDFRLESFKKIAQGGRENRETLAGALLNNFLAVEIDILEQKTTVMPEGKLNKGRWARKTNLTDNLRTL